MNILFTIISPFSSYLREVLQTVTETPPSGENIFIRKNPISYQWTPHFPQVSYRSRITYVKRHRQQHRGP
jgi:hypothetical protein